MACVDPYPLLKAPRRPYHTPSPAGGGPGWGAAPGARPMADPRAHLRLEAERAAAGLPALLAEADRIASSVAFGVHGRRAPGAGETFWEYRRHRREDGAAAVDWRRSAKGDELFVRETEWEAANAVLLWRDGRANMAPASSRELRSKRDAAAVCLIALASLLHRGGERLAVIGETGPARPGKPAFERVAAALANGPGETEAVEAPDLPSHARVVLASDFLDPPETWAARLDALAARRAGGALLRIVDPSEEDFPFQGRTRFEAPGGADGLLFGRAEEARKAYRERWAEHGEALARLARRRGWRLVTHRTDKPAASAVMALHQALAPERA